MTYHLQATTEDSMLSRKVRRVLNTHNNKSMEDLQMGRMVEEVVDVEAADLVVEDMVASKMVEDMTAQMVFREEEDFEVRIRLLAVTATVTSTNQTQCLQDELKTSQLWSKQAHLPLTRRPWNLQNPQPHQLQQPYSPRQHRELRLYLNQLDRPSLQDHTITNT